MLDKLIIFIYLTSHSIHTAVYGFCSYILLVRKSFHMQDKLSDLNQIETECNGFTAVYDKETLH